MKIFSISDLHLSGKVDKPMDIFGSHWDGHWNNIKSNWKNKVGDSDIVLIAGDISWAMSLDDAVYDLQEIAGMPGIKILLKGNHDYWWNSITKVRGALQDNMYAIQNDSVKIGRYVIAGSRGWVCPGAQALAPDDEKLYLREYQRLMLSLKDAERKTAPGDKLLLMMHFPPFSMDIKKSLFTDVIEQAKPEAVVYGHLHNVTKDQVFEGRLRGVRYIMTSCDYIGFDPVEIVI